MKWWQAFLQQAQMDLEAAKVLQKANLGSQCLWFAQQAEYDWKEWMLPVKEQSAKIYLHQVILKLQPIQRLHLLLNPYSIRYYASHSSGFSGFWRSPFRTLD